MNKNNKTNIFILAGEPSGDMHGANLIKKMKQEKNEICFVGIGGEKMLNAGLTSLIPMDKLSVMGFWEVIKQLSFFIKLEKLILKEFQKQSFDKIILIDYPGFNLRLAKKIKQNFNIPVFFYVSPQIWAWKESRIQTIKQFVDEMIVLFPFEINWYKKRGVLVKFFGHPIVNNWQLYKKGNTQKAEKTKTKIIGFFPGSREQEIKKHIPVFLDTIRTYKNKNIKFIVSKVAGLSSSLFEPFKSLNVDIVEGSSFSIFKQCNIAIVSSGTATLECAISKTPFIAVYKMSTISWFITKLFFTKQFACIVNILLKTSAVPELLQNQMNSKNIIFNIDVLLLSSERKKQIAKFEELENTLKQKDAYLNTAKFILQSK